MTANTDDFPITMVRTTSFIVLRISKSYEGRHCEIGKCCESDASCRSELEA